MPSDIPQLLLLPLRFLSPLIEQETRLENLDVLPRRCTRVGETDVERQRIVQLSVFVSAADGTTIARSLDPFLSLRANGERTCRV